MKTLRLFLFCALAAFVGILTSGCKNPIQDTTTIIDKNNPTITGPSTDSTPTRSKTWTWSCSVSDTSLCEFQYMVSTNPIPVFTSEPWDTTTTATQGSGDGIYYLHVRVRNRTDTALTSEIYSFAALLDNTPPQVASISGPVDGYYGLGGNVDVTVTMNEIVNVTGTPRVVLTIGSISRFATYQSGSGTDELVFRYNPLAGDNDTDGISFFANSFDMNGGTMQDLVLFDAPLSFAITPPAMPGVLVDTTAPTVLGLSDDTTPRPSKTWAWGCSESCTYRYLIDMASGTLPFGAFSTTSSATHNTGSGSFYIHVQAMDAAGNLSAVVHVFAILNATAPPLPGSWTWTMSSPTTGSISSDNTPQFAISNASADNGVTVQMYDDSSCLSAVGSAVVIAGGAASITNIAYPTNGTFNGNKPYYVVATGTQSNVSPCTDISRSYFFDNVNPNSPGSPANASAWVVNTTTSPNLTWTTPSDPGGAAASGLANMNVGLSTSVSGGNDVSGWVVLPPATTTYSFSGLTLSQCVQYYPSFRGVDAAGNPSAVVVSTPYRSDATAPTVPVFTLGVDQDRTRTPTATFTTASTDTCSFAGYDFAISRDVDRDSVLDAVEFGNTLNWTNIGNVASYQRTGLALTASGMPYFVSFRGRDTAGNVSSRADSPVWIAQHCDPITAGVAYYSHIVTAPTSLSSMFTKSTTPGWSLNDYFAVGSVNNIISTTTAAIRPQADSYSLMFSSFLEVKTAGTYTFYTNSDEGSDLYINTTRVVANDGLHTVTEQSGSLALAAGCHNMQVRYFDNTGADEIATSWMGPGIAKATIPSTVLFRRYAPMPEIDWKLNTGSGTVATDASMNGLNGTLFGPAWNGTAFCTAAGSNSLNFDGATNEYVQTASDLTGADIIQTDFTISFWTRFTATTAGMVMMDLSNGATPGLVVRTGPVSGTIGVDASGDVGAAAYSSSAYNGPSWHHVVVIRRGTNLRVFVDNVPQINLIVAGTATTFNRVTLGRRSSGTNYFTGDLDQIKIWNQALDNTTPTSSAVAELYAYPCR